jgi:hypothetical protein
MAIIAAVVESGTPYFRSRLVFAPSANSPKGYMLRAEYGIG